MIRLLFGTFFITVASICQVLLFRKDNSTLAKLNKAMLDSFMEKMFELVTSLNGEIEIEEKSTFNGQLSVRGVTG